jgi:lysozyme
MTWDSWLNSKRSECEEKERHAIDMLERGSQRRQKRDMHMTDAPQFADISTFNPLHLDWQAYRQWSSQWDGIARVAMRSSYGVGYTDSHFAEYRAGALTAGIDVILMYHYSYPQYNFPTSEAAWQKKVVGAVRPQDLLILDFEESTPSATAAWALAWLTQQEQNYSGKLPGIYASSAYIQARLQDARLAKYPLWLANWQFTPDARPPCPSPWTHYEYLQYTDRATIPGIAGQVDANIFLGAPMQHYGPASADFDQWFTVTTDNNWLCKQTSCVIMGGNKALYSEISLDGNTLPIIGLPRTSELYQHDSDGYAWSVQFFERGLIVYDPQFRKDSQPGCGASYFGKYPQFAILDPG